MTGIHTNKNSYTVIRKIIEYCGISIYYRDDFTVSKVLPYILYNVAASGGDGYEKGFEGSFSRSMLLCPMDVFAQNGACGLSI
jgi:hypothetical protein